MGKKLIIREVSMKKINKKCGFLLLVTVLVFCFVGEARTKRKKRRQKRVVINFEDELLEGNVSNPSIFHLFHKKELDYGRLVKFRKNFLPEMRRTAREIK